MENEVKYLVKTDVCMLVDKLNNLFPELDFVTEINLPAVYYDTVDNRLERAKAIIRVRKEGYKWVGCYKAMTFVKRQFIEEEVVLSEEEKDEIMWINKLNNYNCIKNIIEEQLLEPVVYIDTSRRIFNLVADSMELEIAIDCIKYHEGLTTEYRLEIELKKGNMEEFGSFLTKFAESFNELEETEISKYQQAKILLHKIE